VQKDKRGGGGGVGGGLVGGSQIKGIGLVGGRGWGKSFEMSNNYNVVSLVEGGLE